MLLKCNVFCNWGYSFFFFFSSRRRHTIFSRDCSSDVCSSDLARTLVVPARTPEIDVPASALSVGPATELTGTDAMLQNMTAATGQAQWMTCGSADATCADARAIAADA